MLVVLLICALLFNAAAVGETYSEEIKFRGLDWGCSFNDALNELKSSAGLGLYENLLDKDTDLDYFYDLFVEKDADVHYLDFSVSVADSGFEFSARDFSEDFFVAGHLVSEICVFGIYGVVNGKVSTERSDAKFYKGSYYFETTENTKTIYDDLVAKLTEMYGEPSENDFSYSDYSLIWSGANNTAVTIEFDDGKYPMLNLDYWDLNCLDLIVEMQNLKYTGDLASKDGL